MFRVLLPSIAFYARAAVHMGRAALKARRGRLTNADLVSGSHGLRRSLEAVGVRFDISGLDGIDWRKGPYVFVANHMSSLETQILPSILHEAAPCTFVIKSSLLTYPVFGSILRGFNPIAVDRVDPKSDLRTVITEGTARLQQGISVIIFPQAQRTETFNRKAFNSIGMRLARAAGVPMVPVALATTAWLPGRWIKDIGWIVRSRPARFAFGTPIGIGADAAGAHRQVVSFIEAQLEAWDRPAPGPAIPADADPAAIGAALPDPLVPTEAV